METYKTAKDLLKLLLRVNKHGVWCVTTDDSKYLILPKWMWGYCKRICPDAKVVGESK